jgi:hypothetical protein
MPRVEENLQSLFAAKTQVPVSRTIEALKHEITQRYKGTIKYEGTDYVSGKYYLVFTFHKLDIRLSVPHHQDEQKRRQAFRVLLLMTKAQLESVLIGNKPVEEAFYGDLLLPDGKTVGDYRDATLHQLYNNPPALPAPAARKETT